MNTLLNPVRIARILAAALAGLLALVTSAQTPSPTTATGEDWSFPYTVTPSAYGGIFNGLPDPTYKIANGQKRLKWSTLNPTSAGNSSAGVYDFSALESALHTAYLASPRYLIAFRLEASVLSEGGIVGNDQAIPQWVVNKYSLSPTHTFQTDKDSRYDGDGTLTYVAPWHSGVQTEFNNFIQALTDPTRQIDGYPYLAHPCLAAIYLHGGSQSRGEEMTVNGTYWMTSANGRVKAESSAIASGFRDSNGGTTNRGECLGNALDTFLRQRMTYWVNALAYDPQNPSSRYYAWGDYLYKVSTLGAGRWEGTSFDGTAGLNFVNDAITQGLGTRGGIIEYYFTGALNPTKFGQRYTNGYIETDWNADIRDGRFFGDENENAHKYVDPISGGDLYDLPGPVRDLAFRSPFFRAAQLGINHLWAGPRVIERAAKNNPNESTTDGTFSLGDLSGPSSVPYWYSLVAGKGPESSPDAACWLRKAEVTGITGQTGGAAWKNMEHLLLQRDVSGAMTQPAELLAMPFVANKPATDADGNNDGTYNRFDYDEYTARRTDIAGGSRKIAFKLDPQFKASLSYPLQIKVTFKDTSGALDNAWKVTVVKSGNTTVDLGNIPAGSMSGSGAWKTATFTVTSANAFISNPSALGADIDFAVNVPSATQDLTVRYVRVVRTAAAAGSSILDANSLTQGANSGDAFTAVTYAGATNGNFLRYGSNAVGDFCTLNVSVATAATYRVTIRYLNNAFRGICQLGVDGANVGVPQDLYASSPTWVDVVHGNVALAAGTRAFTFTITGKNAASSTYEVGIDTITLTPVPNAPDITTTLLPPGRTTVSYGTQQLTATGGTPPYTWSISAGALPAGLTLSSSGAITGTPTTAGTSSFTVRVTDGASVTDDQLLSIDIAANSIPNITTTSLPGGTTSAPYTQTIAATGGDGALVWSIVSGALPDGLTLNNINEENAVINGSPTTAGTANFTLQLADVDGNTDTQAFSLVISGLPEVEVQGNGATIFDGATTPSTLNDTDFGATDITSGTITKTYTIKNTGTGPLAVGTVTLSGTHAADFSVAAQPASSVAAAGSTTFQVTFNPSATGLRSATISFTTDDADENPCDFAVQGTGTSSAPIVYDVNSLTILNSSADARTVVTYAGSTNGNFLRYESDEVGDFINLQVSAPATGSYQVSVRYLENAYRGISQLAIDGTNLGAAQDLYASGPTFADIVLGTVSLSAGLHTFGFTITGKNASSNDYELPLDAITLTPVVAAPEANVQGNSTTIADGDTTPSLTDHTDFGSADINGVTVSRTYTIQNTGTAALTVGTVTVSGTHASNFAVTAQPATSVAAGASTTFTVQFDPSATGLRTAALSFSTNDSDENPYNFSIQGTGTSIAYRAAASANSGGANVTSQAVNKPAGVVSGDFLLAVISHGKMDVGTITAPSGWTLVRQVDDDYRMSIYRKIAGGSEPASYTWTWNGTARQCAGGIIALSGVNQTTPIQVENAVAEGTTAVTSHTTPSITTTGSATWLITAFGASNLGESWTPPAGMTERVDNHFSNTANAPSVEINTEGPVAAGSKQRTATSSAATNRGGMAIIAIQP